MLLTFSSRELAEEYYSRLENAASTTTGYGREGFDADLLLLPDVYRVCMSGMSLKNWYLWLSGCLQKPSIIFIQPTAWGNTNMLRVPPVVCREFHHESKVECRQHFPQTISMGELVFEDLNHSTANTADVETLPRSLREASQARFQPRSKAR